MIDIPTINPQVAILWDLDGTLLTTGGAGVPAFSKSLSSVLNCPIEFDREKFAGWTDHQIGYFFLKDVFADQILEKKLEVVIGEYSQALKTSIDSRNTKQIDRAGEKIEYLKIFYPWISHFVVTGNVLEGAKVKLKASGLIHLFSDNSIFTSKDKGPRSEIVRSAIDNTKTSYQETIVIGDTIHDYFAAKENNIPSLLLENPFLNRVEHLKDQPRMIPFRWEVKDLIHAIKSTTSLR